MTGRPCKHGERINGKCPSKPKTRKQRSCKYGPRVNGKCPPKPKTKKQRPCKYGERVNGKCPPKSKKSVEKYAHHVKSTIRYYGDFSSEKKLSNWFKNGNGYPDEDDNDVSNFRYKPEIVKDRYGYSSNYVHVEFDTNRDENYIIHNILEHMEDNDPDGNYPVNGKLVRGELINNKLYISNI